jgi:hypothetical protein
LLSDNSRLTGKIHLSLSMPKWFKECMSSGQPKRLLDEGWPRKRLRLTRLEPGALNIQPFVAKAMQGRHSTLNSIKFEDPPSPGFGGQARTRTNWEMGTG